MLDYHLHLWPHSEHETPLRLDQLAAYCERAQAVRAFNDKVVNDPRVVCVLTTVRDGVTLIRRATSAGR